VGSLYFNGSDGTNPATLLGYGTWAAFGEGKVVVSRLAGDPDFGTAGATGGAKTVAAAGTNSGCAVAQHAAGVTGAASAGAQKVGTTNSTVTLASHTHTTPALTHSVTQPTFAGTPTSVLQPFIVAYCWIRTA
jgi:hypothetical protein